MKHQVKYQLDVSIDAMDAALKAVLGDKALPAYKTEWVDLCDTFNEDGERYASIEYPDKNCPDVTRTLFFKIMCVAMPLSRHERTGFYVTASASTEVNGKTVEAVNFQDHYMPQWDDGYSSKFWIKEDVFAANARDKLSRIAKICMEETGHDY